MKGKEKMSEERDILIEVIEAGKEAERKLREHDMPYGLGDRFKSGGEKFLLAGGGNKDVFLVSLESGNRVGHSTKVKASGGITREEFANMGSCKVFIRYWDNTRKLELYQVT